MTKKEVKFYKEKNLTKNQYCFFKVKFIKTENDKNLYEVTTCLLLNNSPEIAKDILSIPTFSKLHFTDKSEYTAIKEESFNKKFKETLKLIK